MSTKITNITGGAVTLPVYGNLLAPGQGCIVADTQNQTIAKLGGTNSVSGVFRVETSTAPATSGSNCCADGDVTIYVSTTGNDSRRGNTLASAVQTMRRAFQLIPASHSGNLIINVGAGAFDLDQPFQSQARLASAPLSEGTALQILGTLTDVFGTKTANANTNGSYIGYTAVGLGSYRGQFVECVTSANGNAGIRRTIVSNTAGGDFYVDKFFPNPVVIGDTFKIYTPATIFNVPTFFILGWGVGRTTWKNLQINGLFFWEDFQWQQFISCQFYNGFVASFHCSQSSFSHQGGQIYGDSPVSPNPGFPPLYSSGCYFNNSGFEVTSLSYAILDVVADFCYFASDTNSSMFMNQPDMRDCFVENYGQSKLQINGAGFWDPNGRGTFLRSPIAAHDDALLIVENCDLVNSWTNGVSAYNASKALLNNCTINNSSGVAVFVGDGSFGLLDDITGTLNTVAGIQVYNSSKVIYGAGTTVTGAGGDIILGTAAATPYAGNQSDTQLNLVAPRL